MSRISTLRSKITGFSNYLIGRFEYKTVDLLGRVIHVKRGTISGRSDYDDAWGFYLIRRSRTFLDIGCNTGFFSLIAKLDDPSRVVVAVDANPRALATAAQNLLVNGLTPGSHFVQAYISSEVGRDVTFYTVGTGAAGSSDPWHARTAAARGVTIPAKTTTIDRLCADLALKPDLVKIDVEGAEIEALKGAADVASARSTRFLVELHRSRDVPMSERGAEALHWCQEMGYSAFYLKEHVPVETSAPFNHRGRCHLLLQPLGWEYPYGLTLIDQSAPLEAGAEVT